MKKIYKLFGSTYESANDVAKHIDGILDTNLNIYETLRERVANRYEVHKKKLEAKPERPDKLSEGEKIVLSLSRESADIVWKDIKARRNYFHSQRMVDDYGNFMGIIEKRTDPNYIRDVIDILDRLVRESYAEEIPESLKVNVFKAQLECLDFAIELLEEYKQYNATHLAPVTETEVDDDKEIQ